MGKRKPRRMCPVEGCQAQIIHSHLMCKDCWKSLPAKARQAHMRRWKELRQFVDRRTNTLLRIGDEGAAAHALLLVRQHHRSCDLLIAKANRIRAASGVAPENSIERELKDLGLL